MTPEKCGASPGTSVFDVIDGYLYAGNMEKEMERGMGLPMYWRAPTSRFFEPRASCII